MRLPIWCYLIFGLVLLFLATWPFVLLTLRTLNYFEYLAVGNWFVGWQWAGLTSFALIWGCVNLFWGKQALQRLDMAAGYGHLALAICCGVATLGLHGISAAKSYNVAPDLQDVHNLLPAESAQEDLSGPIYGNVNRGKAWFSLTCVTCHGPTGEGINDLAPSLKESQFLQTADPVDINLLIRGGRAITDPANLSGKPMPARGGERTLTSEKIADLVAYVMSMHERTADDSLLSWEGVEAPEPELSRASFVIRPPNETVRSTTIGLLRVHGGLMTLVCLGSAWLLTGWLRGRPTKKLVAWWSVSGWGWMAAMVSWFMLLGFFGW